MQRVEDEDQARQQEESMNKDSPSFRLIQMDSPERISAAVLDDSRHIDHHGDDDDFDFSFIPIPQARPPIAADDIFSDGKILSVYPLFNRDLLLNLDDEPQKKEAAEEKESKSIRLPLRRLFIEEEREQASFSSTSSSASSSSSSLDELDGIAPGTYCVWNPPNKNDRCKKSSSTGSSPSLRWRLMDLVVCRSQSDGKEKFVSFPIQEEEPKKLEKNNSSSSNCKGKKLSKKSTTTEVEAEADVVTAQQRMTRTTHYGQRNGQEVGRSAGRKWFV